MQAWGRRADPIAVELPLLDGSTWPGTAPGAAHGFGSATMHRSGLDTAFTARAHVIADAIMARVVPAFDLEATTADLPHVIDLLRSAAQTGAGIGLVDGGDRSGSEPISADAAGALQQALTDLPPLRPALAAQARYVVQSGYVIARRGDGALDEIARRARLGQ